MKQSITNNLILFLRNLYRNTMLRNIVPKNVKGLFMNFFDIEKNLIKLLRKEIIGYYKNTKAYPTTKVKDSIDFLKKYKNGLNSPDFLKIWLNCDNKAEKYFDFNGARLPDISHDIAQMEALLRIFLVAPVPDTIRVYYCQLHSTTL